MIAFLIGVVLVTYFYFKWRYTYWTKRKVVTLPSKVPFGSTQNIFFRTHSIGVQMKRMYDILKTKKVKFGGIFLINTPCLLVVDPYLLKLILAKDFQHFTDHANYINEKKDPITGHLFLLKGQKWKNMRTKLTPTFTSGKMKMMFPTLVECSKGLIEVMDKECANGVPIDIKEMLARFTTDIIGSCAFGLDCNCLKDPKSEFIKYGKKTFGTSLYRVLINFLSVTFPSILDTLNIPVLPRDIQNFFINMVKDTVEYREKNNVTRKDFMQLLIQLKNKGFVTEDHYDLETNLKYNGNQQPTKALTIEEIAAQAFVFFVAGFETSSTTLTFCLYELVNNLDIQEKLRHEILTVLEKYEGELTYDAIMNMPYMERCINETLRKYPPLPMTSRECTIPYTIPGTNLTVEKGQKLFIPILGLHRDPEYYPGPEIFNPDRFSEESIAKRPHYTFMPFGEGARACIGLRFGMMQMKVGLIALLSNFKLTLSSKTIMPMEICSKTIIMTAVGGIWINAEKLEKKC